VDLFLENFSQRDFTFILILSTSQRCILFRNGNSVITTSLGVSATMIEIALGDELSP
jgi:hypothetical protein